ncbi:ABC transporter ATP-binding protein [Jonesia quinghaiensis]|uniref:ABC transporter ATP-binding protein n=1 Tax=Jonesia quinghaiensis TaxID=262806 RepID=UPI000424C22D|nr:ABC transporter ATP-binding protein [Jonesia quinghaiensis]
MPASASAPRPARDVPRLDEWYDPQRPVRTLARLFRPERAKLAGAAAAYAIKHSPVWVMPLLTAMIIDIVVEQRPLRELWIITAILVVIIAQNLPISIVYIKALSLSVRNVESGLRMALAQRLQELSIGYHRRMSAGVLQAKIVRDVENVVESSRQTFDSALGAVTTMVGALVITAIRTPEFLPIFLLAVPASAALIVAMRKRMTARNRVFRQHIESMSARVSEMTHLIPITRAHALERRELDRLDSTLVTVREAGIRLDVFNGRFGALAWITFQLLSVACLVGAAYAAYTGLFGVSAGDVVMLSTYFIQLTGSVTVLLTLAPMIAKGLESVRSMGEVLVADELERNEGKTSMDDVRGDVEFDNVTFQYDDADTPALHNVTLAVPAGETVAFVGPSGSGKSTILNMVIGFLSPTGGTLRVDGQDMSDVDLRSFRKHMAVVPQESLLFEGSVRDNVTYGSVDLPDSDVWQSLRDANAAGFVEEMGGLDAVIGERGARLSGGQRQRLAIARALIRNPRILILDEATSALDNESERLVQEALERLMAGRTTFVVAHRLSTIRGADRIVVMRDGKIVETGSHRELLDAGGEYATMAR